jgi:hypothetical protein
MPITHGLDEIVGISLGERSPGLHASDIYGDLAQDLEPKRFTGGAPDPLRLELGLALESVLEKGLRDRWAAERPKSLVVDSVHFSPDLIIQEPVQRLGEIKLTWMSSRDVPREAATSFPPKFRKYFWQMMFYCYGLGISEARLLAYFVNGTGRSPELLAWDISFTAQELRENYQMLMNHLHSKPYLLEKRT